MSKATTISVTGMDKTIKNLIRYNEDFYQKATMISKNAATIVENVAKQDAPVGKTGNLRRSIKKKKVDATRVAFTVMPRSGKGGNHRHLVSYGTAPRRQKKTGRNTGVMPENDFMSDAEKAAEPYFESSMKAEARRDIYI